MESGGVCYLPWLWLQIDGPVMESQGRKPGSLCQCCTCRERGGGEREGEGEEEREGGWWGGVGWGVLPAMVVAATMAGNKNMIVCNVGPRASKTPPFFAQSTLLCPNEIPPCDLNPATHSTPSHSNVFSFTGVPDTVVRCSAVVERTEVYG